MRSAFELFNGIFIQVHSCKQKCNDSTLKLHEYRKINKKKQFIK